MLLEIIGIVAGIIIIGACCGRYSVYICKPTQEELDRANRNVAGYQRELPSTVQPGEVQIGPDGFPIPVNNQAAGVDFQRPFRQMGTDFGNARRLSGQMFQQPGQAPKPMATNVQPQNIGSPIAANQQSNIHTMNDINAGNYNIDGRDGLSADRPVMPANVGGITIAAQAGDQVDYHGASYMLEKQRQATYQEVNAQQGDHQQIQQELGGVAGLLLATSQMNAMV